MKKIIIIVLVLAVIGGGVYFFMSKNKSETKEKEVNVGKNWNPYATDDNHLITLDDKQVVIAKGELIGQITVTLKFKDEHGYEKFEGLSKPLTAKEKEEAEAGGGHGGGGEEEAVISPMNVKINSLISDFMMNIGTEEAKDINYIQENLKNYLNENLGVEKDLIKEILVEQYVFQ